MKNKMYGQLKEVGSLPTDIHVKYVQNHLRHIECERFDPSFTCT